MDLTEYLNININFQFYLELVHRHLLIDRPFQYEFIWRKSYFCKNTSIIYYIIRILSYPQQTFANIIEVERPIPPP